MKYPGKNKSARTGIRVSLPLLILVLVIVASVLIIYSTPVLTIEKRTSGNLTFIDGAGDLLSGTIEISMIGAPPGRKSNVNSITWRNAPNAWIYFDAYEKENISINLRISGDSPNGRVSLEDHGAAVPGSVGVPVSGVPVKYVELHSTGVSFADADISIYYTDAELKGLDETSLVIYSYDGGAWTELPTRVDAAKNIVSAAVVTLSVFAVSARASERIEIRDTRGMPVTSEVKTYDEARTLKKQEKTSTISSANIPDGGELEVDALASKNVAVRLKVKAINKGEIVLDDFGKNNPVSVPLPGMAVKYVEIGAPGISFSSARITIHYTDAELNGGSESELKIYHWNGASWDAVPTIVDTVNKTISASTASLSVWGVATPYRQTLRCDTGTSIGTDVTDSACGSSYTTFRTALLLAPTGATSSTIQFSSFTGEQMYAYFVNNTAYSTDVNVTGVNGSISMDEGTSGTFTGNAYGLYQLGYYDPNGAADNFVELFNSTETSAVTTGTKASYAVSFAAQYGTIPANNKLAVRVYMRTTTSKNPRFYTFTTSGDSDSSINITIATPEITYNLSGYVTNASDGAALSGATVQTNTSLSTITNASGFYNFTSISNGTYIITASLTGYDANSTTVTINGANLTNANISLSPMPTYPVSGYVTNASSSAAINGATVTTNTSQTTTTNSLGYYSFSLYNGTYIITASKTDYDDNSTTITVNGAVVTNANISLVKSVVGSRILIVQTSRYSVFSPWTGKPASGVLSTDFMAYALLMGTDGMPDPGENITFEIYSAAVKKATLYDVTKSNGLANVSYDTINDFTTSGDSDYGAWNITAYLTNDTSIRGTVFMEIDAGGSAISGCGRTYCHWSSSTTRSGGLPRSPYTEHYGSTNTRAAYGHYTYHDNNGCYYCHPGYSATKTGSYGNTSDVHSARTCDYCHGTWSYITGSGNYMPKMPSCYDCHPKYNNNLTNISTLANLAAGNNISVYSYNYDRKAPLTGHNGTNYSYNKSVPCIVCHGPAHNITKPELIPANTNNITEYTQCTSCHNAYKRHNNSVNCTVCHSQDAHVIKVFAQNATYINGSTSSFRGNCTNCHQNSTFMNALLLQPKAGSYTGRNPPLVAVPLEHSNDPTAGAKWKQTYWTNNDQLTWCYYCHSNTLHKTGALGRPSQWRGTNIVNSSIGNTNWCAGCHWKNYSSGTNTYDDMVGTFTDDSLLIPPEISGHATYGANTSIYEYTNHSGYTTYYPNMNDSACNRCHGYNYGFTTITRLVHNQSRVGGANCADCHDIGGIALLARVNVTAANDTNAIHKNLSKNAAHVLNTSIYYDNNLRCWACHGNGSEPSIPNAHPTKYKIPYNCTDCHNQSATQNFNYTPNNTLLNVSEHYWNGTDIRTPNATSCYRCHNLSEMMIPAKDPDSGSGAVYGGANGGNNSTSHYGKKRNDIRIGISANCSYCHQNISTAFAAAMIDPTYNRSINNHSSRYSSSNPNCTAAQCHSTGFIHNSTLTKPNLTLPNSTFCLNCHGKNASSGLINFTGAVTSIKEKHNNSVNCTECHLNITKDIHPVKYLQPNASFNTSNSTAVNCINCHQNLTVYPNLSRAAPKIPDPMHHSDNASNGTLWNSTAYWTPTNPLTSCIYCHNDTKHNASALGRPANWKGNNIVNSSLSTGTWCASCHYRNYTSGGKNYSNMTGAFTSANLPVPPEITNGSYAVNIYNRSNYYNHSLKDYSDAVCRLCHGVNLSSSTTISAFLHNITWGSCTSCHYSFEAMNNTTRPDRYVDSGMYNTSLHRSLSCTNCHTKGHKNIGARKACEDCHAVQASPITDKDRHNITATPSTYFYQGTGVVYITDCTKCHNATLYNTSISTYGYWKPKDCDYCHTYS